MVENESAPLDRRVIILLILGALIVFVGPGSGPYLAPFRWFTTFVHEAGHGVAAVLVGGEVRGLTISQRGGGLTAVRVPDVTLARVFVGLAGYLSAALVGAGLLVLTQRVVSGRVVLYGLAGAMLLVAVGWVPWSADYLGGSSAAIVATGSGTGDGRFTWTFAVGAALLFSAIGALAPPFVRQAFLVALAALLCCSGASDLFTLLGISATDGGHSDAEILADVTSIPALVWATLMSAVAGFAFWHTLRAVLR